jgi:hypothetical protein
MIIAFIEDTIHLKQQDDITLRRVFFIFKNNKHIKVPPQFLSLTCAAPPFKSKTKKFQEILASSLPWH